MAVIVHDDKDVPHTFGLAGETSFEPIHVGCQLLPDKIRHFSATPVFAVLPNISKEPAKVSLIFYTENGGYEVVNGACCHASQPLMKPGRSTLNKTLLEFNPTMIGPRSISNALLLLLSTIDPLIMDNTLAKFDLKAIFLSLLCYSA